MLGKLKDYIRRNTKYGKSRYLNFLYQYDLRQYLEHSCMNENNQECMATQIRILVHAIEKGMALPNPRPGFGKDKVLELIELNEKYQAYTGHKDEQINPLVHSIIAAYILFQKEKGVQISFIPDKYLEGDKGLSGIICVPVDPETNFAVIAHHRHSTRSYADKQVSKELIENIVRLAQTAPSACNRQATRIYACVDRQKKETIMKMHGGVRGFDLPGVIYVITGDLNLYQNEYERNAVYIDGGIFLMNLLYSIDSVGLASCPVIWGSEPTNDKILSDLIGFPRSEKIISLVFSGYYSSDEYTAAASVKRDVKDILRIV